MEKATNPMEPYNVRAKGGNFPPQSPPIGTDPGEPNLEKCGEPAQHCVIYPQSSESIQNDTIVVMVLKRSIRARINA